MQVDLDAANTAVQEARQAEQEAAAALDGVQAQLAHLHESTTSRIKELEYWNEELQKEGERLSKQLEAAAMGARPAPRGPLAANRPGSRRTTGAEAEVRVHCAGRRAGCAGAPLAPGAARRPGRCPPCCPGRR